MNEQMIWDRLMRILGINDPQRSLEEGLNALETAPVGYKLYYVTNYAHAEICNGGFAQYFGNSYSKDAVCAYESFQRIGAHGRAQILLRAMATVVKRHPELKKFGTHADLTELLKEYSGEEFSELETQYYKCPEDIKPLRTSWARRNYEDAFL